MAELLLEFFSEEIPATMQKKACDDLAGLMGNALKGHGLDFKDIATFVTPRRLCLWVSGLPLQQPDWKDEKKGPKVGAPPQAIAGFLRASGLDSLDQCTQRPGPKGPIWFAIKAGKGRATTEILPIIIADIVTSMPWPNTMRFADQTLRWIRPLHSIIALFDGEVIKGTIETGGKPLVFGDVTRGHRFFSAGPIRVKNLSDYQTKLATAFVMLDQNSREESIQQQLRLKAQEKGLTVLSDGKLLQEVVGLVEWPVVILGQIDKDFMALPSECLTATMRTHQKYFSLVKPDGQMAPWFALVANTPLKDEGRKDGEAKIRAGNERVLRARLADAKFFWDQDRTHKLEENLPKLAKVIFHAKLGTVADRCQRMVALAPHIIAAIKPEMQADAKRAAELAKADLVSEMVNEFPELQGIMGGYYARAQGETEAVARAIADHYAPAGPDDFCPTAPVSIAVAMAEKLDSLCGFWLIDEKPTGSKDPFALRRAALGVVRLVLENQIRLSLKDLILIGLKSYKIEQNPAKLAHIAFELFAFINQRIKAHLKTKGDRHDVIAAIFNAGDDSDLVRLMARLAAVKNFLASDDGSNLLNAYRRATHILEAEEKKDATRYRGHINAEIFVEEEEKALHAILSEVGLAVEDYFAKDDFEAAMLSLAKLRVGVDAFFDNVIVNAEQPETRANRLELLAAIRHVMAHVADFSQIEN